MNTRSLAGRLATLALIVGGVSCRQPPRGRAHVLQIQPTGGEVTPEQLRSGIRITFDRPVAPAKLVGAPLITPAILVEPAISGESRWLDAQTLAFFPGENLRSSSDYTITLNRSLETSPDVALASWKGLSFVHDRVEIISVEFDGDRELQPTRPLVTMAVSQATRAADAARACSFIERRADGSEGSSTEAVPARRELPADAQAAGDSADGGSRSLALTPAKDLRPSSSYIFRCGRSFKPAHGAVGLAKAHDEIFSTHGPAGVKKVAPSGNDVAADGVKVTIEFATPMNPREVRSHVRLEPAGKPAQPLDLAADRRRTVFTWSGDLESDVHYEVRIAPGLQDAFGQTIAEEVRHDWTVGDAAPRLRTEHGIYVVERALGRYPVYTRNLPSFDVRCAAVPETRLAAVLTGPANYDSWWDAAEGGEIADYDKLGLHLHTHTITPDPARNRWHDNSLDLATLCGGRASGVYLLEMTANAELGNNGGAQGSDRRTLASVTDLGLLAKVGNASSLVWVVRLSTGEPVPGATVKIRDLQGKVRFTGRTGADGVVEGPGASKLVNVKPRGETTASGEDEGGEGEWDEYRARRVLVTAQASDDLAVLDTNWNNGIQVWNFAVSEDRRGGNVRIRGFLHSDRGLYRPGDTVHLHGMARVIDVSGTMTLPRKRRIHLTINDPRGLMLLEKDVALTSFGGFSLDLPIAEEARLGDYAVAGKLDDQTFSDKFSVEEYRPRAFEVKVNTPQENTLLGKPLRFELAASYLYGSPLRTGKVTWNVRRRLHVARFPGFDEYVFQDFSTLYDEGRWWARDSERSFSDAVADGELELDASGKTTIVTHDELREHPEPQDYLFEATVEDASGQAVTVGRAVTGHESELYLGMHPSEFVQAVDMPFGVQVVGFDREGVRRAAQAELTLTRRWYDCGTHAGESTWSCKNHQEAEPALRRTVSVPASGSAAVERVVVKEPGEYVVRVSAPDGHGHVTSVADIVYVIGAGEAFWSGDEGDRMTLIASKARYRPGDTARLVPQAQMKGAYALSTLERDGVLWHKVQPLANTGEAVEIPIEPRLAPNAYASVALVRGRTGAGDEGRPRFKMGLVNLEIDSSDKRLTVTVETDRPSYRPGEKVTAKLKVTGADGAPVRAELAVAVADEGVLQIKGYKTPDPMTALYAAWGLGVESSTTWNRVLRRRDPTEGDDEEGGDAGGDEAGRIRSRFLATAFWAPAVVTRADGTASVTFPAPDNLTAFRVMAVGGDNGDRFGAGEHRLTISKPLQASPALPRFLTVGDEAEAAVLLANNTKVPIEATVRLTASGASLRGEASQKLKLAAGSNARVAFPISAATEGAAKLVFRASGGGQADAVQVTLPVQRPAVPETIVVGEGVASGRAVHDQPPLGVIVPGHGALEIALDTTGLSRLDEGLRYLVGYPYGCLEQTTSKVVPMVALTELAKTVELPGVAAGQARTFVEKGIAKVLRHQHDDGGFGLWIGTPSEVHYTAYGLWGLTVARAAGYSFDERVLSSGAAYLKHYVDTQPGAGGSRTQIVAESADRAFAHYVLAILGHPEPGSLARMYEHRAELPIFGRAFLARALYKSGRTDVARSLVGEITASLPGSSGPAVIREGEGGRNLDWYWSSDVRSTALVLSALLEISPDHPAVARLEEGLLAARVNGRWLNTQDNVYGLVALAALAKARATAAEVPVTVIVGNSRPIQHVLRGGAVERVRVGVDQLAGGKITIETGGRPVFYSMRLRLERPLDGSAADHGLSVSRVYLDPDTDRPLDKIRLGQTIKVRLNVHSDSRLAHVAIVDRLPAGFEPVLTRFRSSYAGDDNRRQLSFWWWRHETAWQNLELRDDGAQLFADVLDAGDSHQDYLVRATTAGSFSAPPVTAEAMYQPQRSGRSAASHVAVAR
jgi:alpha-2-macroglobulin